MRLLTIYYLVLNLLGFLLMGWDKFQAKRKKWRVREKMLILEALAGGVLGAYLGMVFFRHKTKHWYFKVIFFIAFFCHTYFWYWISKR